MGKKRRRKLHLMNFIFIFSTTLIGITILGVVVLLLCNTAASPKESTDAFGMEAIPSETSETMSSTSAYQWEIEKIPEDEINPENEENLSSEPQGQGKYAQILADPEYMAANNIYAKETAAEGEVVLAFGGDILFDPGYSVMAKLLQRPGGIHDSISEDLMTEMQNADILMLNNEFPYSNRGTPTEGKQFTFRAKPEYAELLHEMGTDIVSLANNHAYDYGETALLDTFDTMENTGIPYVGAGRNLEEAMKPIYFIAGDIKIAIVSATQIERQDNPDTKEATETSPGVFRCWNPDKLLEAVTEAKANSDFVIVYIHWGTENTAEPDWAQLDQAPKIVEAGADLIIGAHPHCLQPIQYIDNVPVIYSLGNFWFNSKQVDTCLIKAVVTEEGLTNLQFRPAIQKDCTTSLLYGSEKDRLLTYMRSISPGITIGEDGYITPNK